MKKTKDINHIDYWKNKLVNRFKNNNNLYVRLSHKGQRRYISLKASNKEVAAGRAKKYYFFLKTNGFPALMEMINPTTDLIEAKENLTIGEFFQEVWDNANIDAPTYNGYAKSFRQVVAGVHGIKDTKKKHDYQTGGYDAWKSLIESKQLDTITPEAVNKWKIAYIKKHGNNAVKKESAKCSVNRIIRSSRALFSEKHLSFVKCKLPDPLPFKGIRCEKTVTPKYKSEIKVADLVKEARSELSSSDPEVYKIFLLGLFCGLRRDEIDKLLWKSVDLNEGVLYVEITDVFKPKSARNSSDAIELDPEFVDVLKEMKKVTLGRFVVQSPYTGGQQKQLGHYRCNRHFKKLIKCLREKGITAQKPIHALRKEFGSIVNEKAGIYDACRLLRHSSVKVTESHYIERRKRISTGLGQLLKDVA